MTAGSVSAGGHAFPQAVLDPRRQSEAAAAGTKVVSLSAVLPKLWFEMITG